MARGLGIGRTLILSSILMPVDFGMAVLAMSIVLFVEAITELRVNFSLIRSREGASSLYDTAWTLQIIRGAVCGGVIAGVAPWIGRFYDNPELVGPLYLLAAALFIGGFANVGMAQFYKDMDFRQVFLANVSSRVAALVVSVVFAIVTKSFWAILVGYLVQRIVDVVVSFLLHPRRPKLGLGDIGEIGHHSKWLMVQGVLFQILLRTDVFMIGKFAGTAALGPYYLAKMIAELIGTELATALRTALYSKFVAQDHENIGERRAELAFQTLSAATLLSLLIGAPLSVLLGLCADDLVRFALKEEWASTAVYLRLFSLNALFGIAAAAPFAAILAAGHTRLVALRQAVGLAVFVPTLAVAARVYGLEGVAGAVVITTLVGTVYSFVFAMREVRGDWRGFGVDVLRITGALAVLACVALAVLWLMPPVAQRWHPLHVLRILLAGGLSVAVYCAVLWAAWRARGRPDSYEVIAGGFVRATWRKLRRSRR